MNFFEPGNGISIKLPLRRTLVLQQKFLQFTSLLVHEFLEFKQLVNFWNIVNA